MRLRGGWAASAGLLVVLGFILIVGSGCEKTGDSQDDTSTETSLPLRPLTTVAGITLEAAPNSLIPIDNSPDGLVADGTSSTTITATLISPRGDAVADGVTVTFITDLGRFNMDGAKTAAATTSGGTGKVSVPFISEADVFGTATIVANVGGVAQSLQIVLIGMGAPRDIITGGTPSAAHMGLAPAFRNIAGLALQGIICPVTAIVGDRFGNPVPLNTPVSFFTNGGVVTPQGITDEHGNAPSEIKTGPPTPHVGNLFGLPLSDPLIQSDARTGVVTIMAVTQGEETFIDSNGNGIFDGPHEFDPTDPELDTPEPFIDHVTLCNGVVSPPPCPVGSTLTGDGTFDPTDRFELFIDGNGNGIWDTPNGVWDADKPIFATTTVLFTGPTQLSVGLLQPDGTCSGDPSGFVVPNGGFSPTFCFLVQDHNSYPLVSGTTISVETTVGTISGTRNVILPDIQQGGLGRTFFTFSVADDDPADTDPPSAALVTISVTSPFTGTCPGGNGNATVTISGTVD